jgi:hypothetical protein
MSKPFLLTFATAAWLAGAAVGQSDEPRSLDPEFMPCTVLAVAMTAPDAIDREHYLVAVAVVVGTAIGVDGASGDPSEVIAIASEICGSDQTRTVWSVLAETAEKMRAH